jgi:hypothetical protein
MRLKDKVAIITGTSSGIGELLPRWHDSKRLGNVDHYVFQRFRQWWCCKLKIRKRRDACFTTTYLISRWTLFICELSEVARSWA